jgi:hypothetical protein
MISKMTKPVIICLLFICSVSDNLWSQAKFMPIGAELNVLNWSYGFNQAFMVYSEKDTLCGRTPCRKIIGIYRDGSKQTQFIKQVKDSIFFYDPNNKSFL